ncbi:hypothetical protein ABG768_011730 [Culter alburnus]|uniref:Spermatogenesis-associated protein 46 n=1 Tax=Culter alburnus TaxID=194366 RepID=A0AAW1Z845_CULAL
MQRPDVKPSRSKFLPKLCTIKRGPFGHLHAMTRTTDLRLNHLSRDLQNPGLNACFIQTVTATEVVCGIKRYKCSGCLCYYNEMEQLMAHIKQGWIEGYSCKAFYRKLKDMQDCRELLTVYEEEAASESNPRLSASSTLRQSTKDEKLDMVLRWLQDVTI